MNIEDLQETAQLAHVTMDDQALGSAFPAFEQMLGFFAAMQRADEDSAAFPEGIRVETSGVSLIPISNHFRPDNPEANASFHYLNEPLLSNPGERDGNFVVIPNVL
jgi:aspartyl-tRNA(Asn)/glutamyl-tRNA(Gln) amidotransferase subunit C